ncbi:uncharacterized protein FOMMEDRAFT_154509 [Fomitiporia mediterranea MF3/22]|uniref:uncharacterized protein n=1 Tax=Fomitiporia mediterranea (strain MF3/22) TaxID=694068 RepID=UPI000440909D|nr:uncharacterized protein FOMMEDRAFT_154509 [Fomitiporia mediterranea MF3/22]EJD05278.1 hypothetical protein FOMMEDRAFT_154509 [Fomitiporia mediterranea MF3/22]
MHRRSSVATGKRSRAKEPKDSGTEMETLKSFNIPAYGDFLYTRVDVHFGNSPKPCTLLFDTGAGFTWINKELYETTTPSVGRRLRITVKIKYEFATEEDDIIGELYENSIWFGHGNPVNKKFVFAVVDELNQPLVSKLKWQRNILGILGFQPGEKPFFKQTSIEAPSASYMLLNKPTLYAPIMSIDFRMPKQKAYQSVSISKIAAPGHIRIGEVESNALDHRHWIWHNATKLSRSKLATTKKPMIILGHVWITRYDIVFDYGGSRIGLAEAEGKTDYTWDELH